MKFAAIVQLIAAAIAAWALIVLFINLDKLGLI